jgi:hypothetical protein
MALAQAHVRRKNELYYKRLEEIRKWHEEESKHYISPDNINEKITANLFRSDATSTGLTNKYSDLWRYQVIAPSLKRFRKDSMFMSHIGKDYNQPDMKKAEDQTELKMQITDWVNEMIGTGEDRSKFDFYVSELLKKAEVGKEDQVDFDEDDLPDEEWSEEEDEEEYDDDEESDEDDDNDDSFDEDGDGDDDDDDDDDDSDGETDEDVAGKNNRRR